MEIFKCTSAKAIYVCIQQEINRQISSGNLKKDSSVFIKTNANSNMNALTGNTTDLRLLSAIISTLKEAGITNIKIGDGTNSGYYREGIDVLSRLRIRHLAQYHGIEAVDLNYSKSAFDVPLENGVMAQVASIIKDVDFFINCPKIKMHYETFMTCALKNLMGTLIGRENKKKIHASLIKNIVNLNKEIKPSLTIIDGLISMEGNGPTKGTPVKTDVILIGDNSWELDAAVAGIAGVDWNVVPVLAESNRQGIISNEKLNTANNIGKGYSVRPFRHPHNNFLVSLVTNKKLQKYFIKIRYAPGIKQIANSPIGKKLMVALGISQEVFVFKENQGIKVIVNKEKICESDIQKCIDFCPRIISSIEQVGNQDCLTCLYCMATNSTGAISVEGDLGFFNEQEKQYGHLTRNLEQTKKEQK